MARNNNFTTRRTFVKQALGVTAGGLLAGRVAVAGGHLPKLDPNDPQAQSFKYTHESTTEGQLCSNCQLFKGEKEWGECAIFPGKEVAAKGWCQAWVKKAS